MKVRSIIIISLAVLVVAGIAVVAVLSANVDKYRPRVQAELQKKLNRPVTIGHLGLRLFPLSIRVDGLNIGESPSFSSTRPFATAKEVYVSVALLSLISGNPEVKNLALDQPQIEFIKNASGVWNFSTLGGAGQSSTAQGGGRSDQLTLDELKINDGQVAITNEAAREPRSVYDHIDVKLTDFAPGKQFGIELALHFPGQGKQLLAFNGKVGPLGPANAAAAPLSGHLTLQQVGLSGLNRFAPGTMPPQTDAVASGDTDIGSQNERLSAKGNLTLQNTVVRGSKLDFPIKAQYDVSADRRQDKIQVRSGRLELGSTSFTIEGDVDAGTKPANLNVHVTTKNSSITELARLAGSFGVAFHPAYQVKGLVTADLTARGQTTAPQLNGSLNVRNVSVSGGEIKQPVSVPAIDLSLSPEVVKSNPFTAQSGSTALTLAFAISQYTSRNMNLDATLKTDGANVTELLNMAKAYGAAQGVSGTGKLAANLHVQGPTSDPSKLVYSGTASISNATISTPELTKPLTITSANAQFSQNSASITGMAASLGSTTVRGNLAAKNFAAPDVQFALTADKIDTAELQTITAKSPSSSRPSTPKAHAANKPSLIETMTGSGTLAANSIKAQDLVLSNVRANCKLNRGLITLSPLTADLYGGKESGNFSADVRPADPQLSAKAKLSGVDTNALLSAVSSLKDTIYGSLAADADLRFTLASGSNLARSLNGTVGFNVTKGHLKNVNIMSELSRIGKFMGNAPAQPGSGTVLQRLSGTMNIVNGVASTNNLVAALDAGSLSANGSLNLVNQAIDMHMSAVLAKSATQTVGGTQVGGYLNTALANNKGELVIPVLVTGSLPHPTFTPDAQAIAKMKLNNALPTAGGLLGGKGAGGILNGVLGGSGQQQQQKGPQTQQPQKQQNPVDSLLKQFPKKKK
ncbi:MAG: AsmA family protein [Bryobacteraceae bacterium]